MPDHPHEGVVFDHVPQPDVGLAAITLTNSYDFGSGVSGDEYPSAGNLRPFPMVIAHGRTLADPPLMHEKGDSPAKRFAMISAYDGHLANVGRVVTDSTWHHWMNINITQIEAAAGNNWEKIKRYFLNVGVWLAPAHIPRHCLHVHVLESFYSYPGIVEFGPKVSVFEMGRVLQHHLARLYGPCWVTQLLLDVIRVVDRDLHRRLIERYLTLPLPNRPFPPRPEPCLTCPPPESIEVAVLGGMARSVASVIRGREAETIEASVQRLRQFDDETLDKHLMQGVAAGLEELRGHYRRSFEQTANLLG
jgi:hypothetical protein